MCTHGQLLLKLDSYTLVHFGGPDTSGQERPIGDTLGSAGEEAVLGLVAHKWAMVELKAAQIRDDLAGETAGKVHLEAAKAEVLLPSVASSLSSSGSASTA